MSYAQLHASFCTEESERVRLAAIDAYNNAYNEGGLNDSSLDNDCTTDFEQTGPPAVVEPDMTDPVWEPEDQEVDDDMLTECERTGVEAY